MARTRQDETDGGSEPLERTLERARAAYARRAWQDAYRAFSAADERSSLAEADLEKLAFAAALGGFDAEHLRSLERLYHLQLDSAPPHRAAHTAFWIGFRMLSPGGTGAGNAWLQRAQRLAEREPDGCAVQGYLLIPEVIRLYAAGEYEAGLASANTLFEIGERYAEPNVIAYGRLLRGRAYVHLGLVERGLSLCDAAMLAATRGELAPLVTGLVYCAAMATFQQLFALRRTREWTAALASFCELQPQLVPFAGTCLAHRAELMQLGGAWREADAEIQRCLQRARLPGDGSAGEAMYQQAEIDRMRGALERAEASYRKASELGRDPQPGLSLLRLAQGQLEAAQSAIRRVLGGTLDPLRRAQFLPAYVEIMLATNDRESARQATAELEQTALRFATDMLAALAAQARGTLRLRENDAQGALAALRTAFEVWQQLEAPYPAARMRVLIGHACAALGDRDGAELEYGAARGVFEQLGAARDLAVLDAARGSGKSVRPSRSAAPVGPNLSARELEVLRLVATGKTNKAIAKVLCLSEKTVDRHVSHVFTKLDVRSRAAATAYAYEHALV